MNLQLKDLLKRKYPTGKWEITDIDKEIRDWLGTNISSKVAEPNEFDPAVGLALHEGSHIKLSNFKY